MADLNPPRVLVEVRGGCAEVFATPDISIWFVDYDNEPDALVPEEFRALPPAFLLPPSPPGPPTTDTARGGGR